MKLLSLKSNGPNFVNTVLEINVSINQKDINQNVALSYDITEYHETNSSVFVSYKFKLQE